jgi:hypothetical protein
MRVAEYCPYGLGGPVEGRGAHPVFMRGGFYSFNGVIELLSV